MPKIKGTLYPETEVTVKGTCPNCSVAFEHDVDEKWAFVFWKEFSDPSANSGVSRTYYLSLICENEDCGYNLEIDIIKVDAM